MAVFSAAGASLRMGRPKLLLPFAGGTVVGALAASLRAGGSGHDRAGDRSRRRRVARLGGEGRNRLDDQP